jgi:hypothetical protein
VSKNESAATDCSATPAKKSMRFPRPRHVSRAFLDTRARFIRDAEVDLPSLSCEKTRDMALLVDASKFDNSFKVVGYWPDTTFFGGGCHAEASR